MQAKAALEAAKNVTRRHIAEVNYFYFIVLALMQLHCIFLSR